MRVITLTTDFGYDDWFAGSMKGVILSVNPRVQVVEVTHGIPSGDIRAGAFALTSSFECFPKGTIHIAVVDPGVGSARNAIVIQTNHYTFIGPDNGILSWAVAGEKVRSIRRLENQRYFRGSVSATFHGRDIFAPVAAHLSRGVRVSQLGRVQKSFVQIRLPEPVATMNGVEGEIIYIDHFGNAITNLRGEDLQEFSPDATRVQVGRRKKWIPVKPFYQAVPASQPLGLVGSAGFLELAVSGRSAARALRLKVGDVVKVRTEERPQ